MPPRRPPTRAITLEEVARVAGVSRATVSRVVNGVATVDRALRETVERAISETGYTPNRAARSLVTRRTGAIGLVLPDAERMAGDPHFGRVVSGVMRVTAPLGIQVVLTGSAETAHERVVDDLRRGHLDGVILVHTHPGDPLPRLLTRTGLPVVLASRPLTPLSITYVDVDQAAGGALAGEHLAARGCLRPAALTGPLDTSAARDRLAGFRTAFTRRSAPEPPWVEGDFTYAAGVVAMDRLLAEHPEVDGVFVASDLMAQGALTVLRKHGRRVPADVAVVGFDDSLLAPACDPPLTTVRQPVEDMAAEMARLLLQHVEQDGLPVRAVVFEPALVVRESA